MRFSKEEARTGTHWIRHEPPESGYTTCFRVSSSGLAPKVDNIFIKLTYD